MLVKSLNSVVCIFATPGQISAEDAQRNCCYPGEQRVRFALGRLLLLILVDGENKKSVVRENNTGVRPECWRAGLLCKKWGINTS